MNAMELLEQENRKLRIGLAKIRQKCEEHDRDGHFCDYRNVARSAYAIATKTLLLDSGLDPAWFGVEAEDD